MVEKESRGEKEKKMRISRGEWSRKQEKIRNRRKKKKKKKNKKKLFIQRKRNKIF